MPSRSGGLHLSCNYRMLFILLCFACTQTGFWHCLDKDMDTDLIDMSIAFSVELNARAKLRHALPPDTQIVEKLGRHRIPKRQPAAEVSLYHCSDLQNVTV